MLLLLSFFIFFLLLLLLPPRVSPFVLCVVRAPREDPGCAAFSGRIVSPKTNLRTILTKGWLFHTQNQTEPLYHSIVIRFTKSIGEIDDGKWGKLGGERVTDSIGNEEGKGC